MPRIKASEKAISKTDKRMCFVIREHGGNHDFLELLSNLPSGSKLKIGDQDFIIPVKPSKN